jgi:Aminoglycoside-2''-adenylyltransferase
MGEPWEHDFANLRHALFPMAGCRAPWWVAGGWALDLFLGRVTRPHHDVDVAILPRDQAMIQRHLADWTLHWVEPRSGGQFHHWSAGEWLAPPVHEIHGTHPNGTTIELLLNDAEGEIWHFRRDQRIQRPLHLVGRRSSQEIPYLAPEVVLLYKAQEFRDSDAADFAVVRDALAAEQRTWLAQAIRMVCGEHPWLLTL